jgi:hypothetical protein
MPNAIHEAGETVVTLVALVRRAPLVIIQQVPLIHARRAKRRRSTRRRIGAWNEKVAPSLKTPVAAYPAVEPGRPVRRHVLDADGRQTGARRQGRHRRSRDRCEGAVQHVLAHALLLTGEGREDGAPLAAHRWDGVRSLDHRVDVLASYRNLYKEECGLRRAVCTNDVCVSCRRVLKFVRCDLEVPHAVNARRRRPSGSESTSRQR